MIIRLRNTKVDGGLYDNDMVQTVSYVLQTGGSGFNYTHQQLKFTNRSNILSGSHREKQDPLVFPPS